MKGLFVLQTLCGCAWIYPAPVPPGLTFGAIIVKPLRGWGMAVSNHRAQPSLLFSGLHFLPSRIRLRGKALRKWTEWSVKNKKLFEERWTRGTSGQKDEFFLFSGMKFIFSF